MSRLCRTVACSAPHWEYSPWTACNATCGDSGVARRNATCAAPKGQNCTGIAPLPTTAACNTGPCQAATWEAGAWGTCSVDCRGGQRLREVLCRGTDGAPAAEAACAGAAKPTAAERCNLQPCDFCADNTCSDHGSCAAGACACDAAANVTGAYCQLPTTCASGTVDRALACCPSGLVDALGGCCPRGAALDGRGSCCASGEVDACGACGGTAKFVDSQGQCCAAALDANGRCCKVGLLGLFYDLGDAITASFQNLSPPPPRRWQPAERRN